jgi:molecular chaperone DnaK (HSP70)
VSSRYLIGVDLGTTNSVVAYLDTHNNADPASVIRVFPVPQLVRPGEVGTLPALPSFLYFPTEEELSAGGVSANWNEHPAMVTGMLAREQGALMPNRQVSSAKSWLSYPGVHRRGKILPAQAEPPQPMISPVEASARYLMHLRDGWNSTMGNAEETRFEQQEIVLTVPGSFDEEARELTVEAARLAGLENLTLLEEPLAAFYAWIAANRHAQAGNHEQLCDGELILICDIGGGTTDFSLIRARRVEGELQFERTAIGEHLLLGGDNLDLALVRQVENKLNGATLTPRQRYALRRTCCTAKERLLSDSSLERVPVTILGSGRVVVGEALSTELAREEVLQILTDGFLPITAPQEMPAAVTPAGLRELGLPYASDPAITKHLATFLTQAAEAMDGSSTNASIARPDAVLFNGGFCAPAVTRDRIAEALSAWFGGAQSRWSPKLLHNDEVESAVARGAAYYGGVRRGTGMRIQAGSARTYYIGFRSAHGLQGICVLPAGVEEGTTLPLLNREFSVLANRPVSFTLYSSRTQHDAHGQVTALDEASIHRHPPLVSLLRYGKRRDVYLAIRLKVSFTELGTLELWCESRDTPHRWRLQFELRQAEQLESPKTQPVSARASGVTTSDANFESAAQLIKNVFGGSALDSPLTPDALIAQMEAAVGAIRDLWPVLAIRRFTDALIEVAVGRKKSPRHELRWLSLAGFCLRPGFGAPDDDGRVNRLRTIASDLIFVDDLQCQIGALVLLRRTAGGIRASEQLALYRKHSSAPGSKKKRINRQLEYEKWRFLANLEHLQATTRASLGHELMAKIRKEPGDAIWLWSLGRMGARIPLYGPLHSVVEPEIAGEWLKALMDLPKLTTVTGSTIALIARRTDDCSRDIDETLREQAITRLMALRIGEETVQLVAECVPPERTDAVRSFGESLPSDLQVISSSDCLLSIPALHISCPSESTRCANDRLDWLPELNPPAQKPPKIT